MAARRSDISMAKVLGQLFATTELFDMQTRPELVLLQKSMVLVEGVSARARPRARHLDRRPSRWSAISCGARRARSAGSRICKDHADVALDTIGRLPGLVTQAEAALDDYDADKRSPERRSTRAHDGRWRSGRSLVHCRRTCGCAVHLGFMAPALPLAAIRLRSHGTGP